MDYVSGKFEFNVTKVKEGKKNPHGFCFLNSADFSNNNKYQLSTFFKDSGISVEGVILEILSHQRELGSKHLPRARWLDVLFEICILLSCLYVLGK